MQRIKLAFDAAGYGRPAWTWEYLRCNPAFREFFAGTATVPIKPLSPRSTLRVIEPHAHTEWFLQWGLAFARSPDLPFPRAEVFWDAAADPSVLSVSLHRAKSWPGTKVDVIDFAKVPATVTVLRLETGHEYLRIAQGPYAIQLHVKDGSALHGPVTISSHINGYTGRLKSLTQQRLFAFCRTHEFQRSLFSNKKDQLRTDRWSLALQVLDMRRQGISETKIEEILYGKVQKNESDWRRSRVKRLVETGRRYADGGHLKILTSGDRVATRKTRGRFHSPDFIKPS
ncbi:MAG: DUF2285 domain-containing protein, partial [Phycisphaerales bacterium]|nr:DUF2285 domain-containing protein [Phycisphaerales bacterium]